LGDGLGQRLQPDGCVLRARHVWRVREDATCGLGAVRRGDEAYQKALDSVLAGRQQLGAAVPEDKGRAKDDDRLARAVKNREQRILSRAAADVFAQLEAVTLRDSVFEPQGGNGADTANCLGDDGRGL